MKIELHRKKAPFQFEVHYEHGQELRLDASPDIGGEGFGFRPMETLTAALAGCSAIDIGLILQKQKQEVLDFRAELEGERNQDTPAREFKHIRVHYHLWGDLEAEKVKRAIDLAIEKYCSVALSLHPGIELKTDFTIHTKHV
ncbi:MAG: OsmC family protein [Salibacteraceae bacterium]